MANQAKPISPFKNLRAGGFGSVSLVFVDHSGHSQGMTADTATNSAWAVSYVLWDH